MGQGRYGLKQLALIDERAPELTAEFLQARVDEGKSAYTLQVMRAALRMTSRGGAPQAG